MVTLGWLVVLCAFCLSSPASRPLVFPAPVRCSPVLRLRCAVFPVLFPLRPRFLLAALVVRMSCAGRCFLLRRFCRLLRLVVVAVPLRPVRWLVSVLWPRLVVVGCLSPVPPVPLVCCPRPRPPVVSVVLGPVPGPLWLWRLVWGFLAWFFSPLPCPVPLVGRWFRLAVVGGSFGPPFLSCRSSSFPGASALFSALRLISKR